MKDFKFTPELTALILDGGKVVHTEDFAQPHFIGLVRMPKGSFIKDTRPEYPDHSFEYVIISNPRGGSELRVTAYLNDSLGDARKELSKRYSETAFG
jgi:hypothetical protein